MGCSVWRVSTLALLIGCSSPDLEEAALVDLSACTRRDISCEQSGSVTIAEDLAGEPNAVRLTAGGSIALPIDHRGKKLVWIAMAVRAEGVERALAVTVDGIPGAVVQSNWGFARVEVGQNDGVPAANARLHLIAEKGSFEVLWVVGRWR
jgi:hypothetical protein